LELNKSSGTFEFEMIVEYEHEQFELDFDEKIMDRNRHTQAEMSD
jgi:hypothetical protein